jgi:hypothetical protein
VLLSAQGTTAESTNSSALFTVGWFFPSPRHRAVASDCHRISISGCLSLGHQKGSPLPVPDFRGTPHSHTDGDFSPGHQDASLAGPHEELGTAPPSRRPFVPCGHLPHLLGQALRRASPIPKGANPPGRASRACSEDAPNLGGSSRSKNRGRYK